MSATERPASPDSGDGRTFPDRDLVDASELHDAQQRLIAGDVYAAMEDLYAHLREVREDSSDQEWQDHIRLCRSHSICALVHQDPFTARAFQKPRGYAGDPVMLDMIFRATTEDAIPEETSELGREIFQSTLRTPLAQALNSRLRFTARLLDELSSERQGADVLSVYAGHFREAELAECVQNQQLGRLVCLDADAESLHEIEQSYGQFGVEIMPASIRRLLGGDLAPGTFDFVYSTGAFDSLRLSVGQRLVARMFDMLNPGGRLMVSNFEPEFLDVGYTEAFMDWSLIYRSRADLSELTKSIRQELIQDIRVSDAGMNCLCLEVTRQGS